MSWHDGYPKFILENGEPREAQVGDEPTLVLVPISTLEAHEAFYKVVVAERNLLMHALENVEGRT